MQYTLTPLEKTFEVSLFKIEECSKIILVAIENAETQEKSSTYVDLTKDGNTIADAKGNTWLHLAAALGLESLVRGFLQHKGPKFDVDVRNQDDETPMMVAVRAGQKNIVGIFADNQADVNAIIRSTNWSMLHEASFAADLEMVRLLLNKGARIAEANWLHKNVLINDPELGEISKGAPWLPPMYGCSCGAVTTVLRCKPLIPACLRGNRELIELLIEAGDDPHQICGDGSTALHFCTAINPDVCRWLLTSLHVDPNAGKNETPIHYVRDMSLLFCFVEHGADMEKVDRNDESFLYSQCGKYGDPEMVIFALKHGADLKNVPTKFRPNLKIDGWCGPYWHFVESLLEYAGHDFSTYSSLSFTKYKARMLSPYLVEAVVRAFKERGVAPCTCTYNIRQWLLLTGQKSESLSSLITPSCTLL